MRIGLISYSVSYGGVGTYIISFAKKLKESGHEPVIITTETKGVWFDKINENGIESHHVEFGIWGWIPFGRVFHAYRVGAILRKFNFDLVIINCSYSAQISAAMYRPAKTISVIHNQLLPVVQVGCINAENIDAIVAVSPQIHERALNYAPQEKLTTILNGVHLSFSFELKNRAAFTTSIQLLFVGRIFEQQKGIFFLPDILLELKKRNLSFHLTIVGIGPDTEKLKEKFIQADLIEYIDFKGLLDSDEVYKIYLQHHVLLMPSFYEGLPLTLIEAMGAGCVPLASDLKGSTDICIDDNESGYLIPVGDKKMFADKIEELYSNKTKWEQMSNLSISKANAQFSFDIMMKNYQNLFDNLFAKSHDELIRKQSCFFLFSWKEIIPCNLILFIKQTVRMMFNIKHQ